MRKITDFFPNSNTFEAKESSSGNNQTTKELQSDIEALRIKVAELEIERDAQNSKYFDTLRKKTKEIEESAQQKSKIKEMLAECVLNLETMKLQKEFFDQLHEKAEIGQLKIGPESYDDWLEGDFVRDLKEEKESILKKIEDLTNKKEIKAKKKNTSLTDGDKKELNKYSLIQLQKRLEEIDEIEQKCKVKKAKIISRDKKQVDAFKCYFSLPKVEQDQQSWPLIHNRYQILSLISKGSNAEIYKGFDLEHLEYVAIKLFINSNERTRDDRRRKIREIDVNKIQNECDILQSLEHPSIVKFRDKIIINGFHSTILEYVEGEDLNTFLRSNWIIPEKNTRIIIRQMLLGLRYLNSLGNKIIHFDLNPRHVMLTKDKLIKFIDFTSSKLLEKEKFEGQIEAEEYESFHYRPRECFEKASKLSPKAVSLKVDIWSIGIMAFQMLFGRKPFFDGISNEKIFHDNLFIKDFPLIFPEQPSVSNEMKDFIKKCLVYNPENRIDVIRAIRDFPKIQ